MSGLEIPALSLEILGLTLELAKLAYSIVRKGLKQKSTAKNLKATLDELNPVAKEIIKLHSEQKKRDNTSDDNDDDDDRETEELMKVLKATQKASEKYSEIRWWYFWMAWYYQEKLEEAETKLDKYIRIHLPLQMKRDQMRMEAKMDRGFMEIRSRLDRIIEPSIGPTVIVEENDEIEEEFTVGLEESEVMKTLRSELIKEGGDQILNLTGFAGTGKTTLAQFLRRDLQVRGKFKDNVLFERVGSVMKRNGNVQLPPELLLKLHEIGSNKAVMLMLDDVGRDDSDQFVWHCMQHISSDSKILLISRIALTGLGSRHHMTRLRENDAIALLRHLVQPLGTSSSSSYTLPDNDILLQVVRGCDCYPLALKFVGAELRGKPIEFWQSLLRKWSQQQGQYDSSHPKKTKLLNHLEASLHVLEEYKSLNEFFMDLSLFPYKQRIPVTVFIDMWVELYQQDHDGIDAMTFIHQLVAMNLAELQVERIIGSGADNYYNYHFLTQHDIMRDLAVRLRNKEETKRLVIEIQGNNINYPKWWPQQQTHKVIKPCCILPFSHKPQPKQQRVDARILSISTDQKVTPDGCNTIEAAEAKVLVLNLRTQEYKLPEFLKKMKSLKVIILMNYSFSTSELEDLELFSSLGSLKRVRLENVSVPLLFELKNLQKLSLCECKAVMQDSENENENSNSWVQISSAMPNLQDLDIDSCNDMIRLPNGLCDITTLNKLSISNCNKFKGLPQEIGKLENLELLRVSDCNKFEEMPESITELKSLSFLDISYCVSLTQVPEKFRYLNKLRKLYIMGSSIREFPNSVMNMESLEVVICDEVTFDFWEAIQTVIPNLNIKKASASL